MDERKLISNARLAELRKILNGDIKRRGTYKWWDPMVPPKIGTDRESPTVLHGRDGEDVTRVVSEDTYTVNTPSDGSLEETRNKFFEAQGDNPGGSDTDGREPSGSSTRWDQDEVRNFLNGVAKIQDVDLYYGRDEEAGTVFRNTVDLEERIETAAADKLNEPANEPQLRTDPNNGVTNQKWPGYGTEQSETVVEMPVDLPSGQYDGEEILPGHDGPDPTNFYDDYGAPIENTTVDKLTAAERRTVPMVHDSYRIPTLNPTMAGKNDPLIDYTATNPTASQTPSGVRSGGWKAVPGAPADETIPGVPFKRSYNGSADKPAVPGSVGDDPSLAYHPQNPYVSPEINSVQITQDDYRNETVNVVKSGRKSSVRFGPNPRNPMAGDPLPSRRATRGVPGSCNVACTGLCYTTCDSECTESCSSTCWNRCGDACVSSCGNVCTGCSTLCYTTCKTRCENRTGYSCVNAGAETVAFESLGDAKNGTGTPWPANRVKFTLHSCHGCSYSCQFYPNSKTTCWDAVCQNMCFYSCYSYCSTSCYGGCIDNQSQHDHSTDPLQPKNSSGTNSARYRTGRGQACRENCVADCVGDCQGTCDGTCVTGCFKGTCKSSCDDDCNTSCRTSCGSGCSNACTSTCKGSCANGCSSGCTSACSGCTGGCSGTCYGTCTGSSDWNAGGRQL